MRAILQRQPPSLNNLIIFILYPTATHGEALPLQVLPHGKHSATHGEAVGTGNLKNPRKTANSVRRASASL